jgi:hypothetical protein
LSGFSMPLSRGPGPTRCSTGQSEHSLFRLPTRLTRHCHRCRGGLVEPEKGMRRRSYQRPLLAVLESVSLDSYVARHGSLSRVPGRCVRSRLAACSGSCASTTARPTTNAAGFWKLGNRGSTIRPTASAVCQTGMLVAAVLVAAVVRLRPCPRLALGSLLEREPENRT